MIKVKLNWVVAVAIVCLTAIEIYAIATGHNGTFRMIIVMAISGLAGWRIPVETNGYIKIKDVKT